MVFVALASTIGDGAVVGAVASALGLAQAAGREPLDQIEAALSERRSLLVMDNCEHVVAGAAGLVEALFQRVPHCAVLCTSREPLRIGSERIVALGSLGVEDAVRLFVDRASAVAAPLASSDAERRSIETICRRLDGIPLALELAAACTRALDIVDIERGIDERFRLLTRGSRAVERRHLTLHAAIAWSYDLLETHERLVFERLAIMNGRFTFDDALAVAADGPRGHANVVAAIAGLVDKSLIVVERGDDDVPRTYGLLESTRAFAAQLEPALRADRDLDATRRRLGQRLHENAVRANEAYRSEDPGPAHRMDIDVVRGYLHWAIDESHDVPQGALVAGTMFLVWGLRGLQLEGLARVERALAALPPELGERKAMMTALFAAARIKQHLFLYREAADQMRRAYDLAVATGDDEMRANSASMLSLSLVVLGEHAAAAERVDESLAIYERLGDERRTAIVTVAKAKLAIAAGRSEEGRAILQRSLERGRASGKRSHCAYLALDLSEAEFARGEITRAVEILEPEIATFRELSTPMMVGLALVTAGAYRAHADAWTEAARHASEALAIAAANGYRRVIVLAVQLLALVAAARDGDVDAAAESFGFVNREFSSIGDIGETEQRTYDRLRALLASSLSAGDLTAAMARGAKIDERSAAEAALEYAQGG